MKNPTMEQLHSSTIISLLIVTLATSGTSKVFQWWNPDALFITIGGIVSLLIMPCIVYLLSRQSNRKLKYLAMFFSPFMFASAIDLIISMEYDGYISGFMAFYLAKAEPYLATSYSTAICYWDGLVHYILYWLMLYDFSKDNVCFRSVSLYWFGTFFTSMIVLLVGVLTGPFPIHYPIILNLLYVVFPILYIIWVLKTARPHKNSSVTFASSAFGNLVRYIFLLVFLLFSVMVFIRGLGALGADRELVNTYLNLIEKHVNHPHVFPKLTAILYMFYGIPMHVYFIYCLAANIKSPHTVDISMVLAGMSANAQVGYIGVFVTGKPDIIQFEKEVYGYIFWTFNILLVLVPHIFALYCYNCYPKTEKSSKKMGKSL